MMELTKEFMQDIIKGRGFGVAPSAVEEMARQLLAGMEQEPVAQVYQPANIGICAPLGPSVMMLKPLVTGTKLYASPQLPQPAVLVSEAQSKKLFDEWSGGDGALGELRASGVPDEFISMLKEFSLATWEACREAMLKHSAPFIVTSDHRMMEMPKVEDIDAVASMLQGAEQSRIDMLCKVLKNAPLSPSDSQGREKADIENDNQQFESLSRGDK